MSKLATCKHSECDRKDNCKRWLGRDNENCEVMDFKNICVRLGYKWFWEVEVGVVAVKGEGEEKGEKNEYNK